MMSLLRRIGIVCLLAALIFPAGARADLLGFWNFDDPGQGDYVASQAHDRSGSGNDGVLTGPAAYTASAGGRSGLAGDYAMDFGAAGNSAYVSLPTAASDAFNSVVVNNAASISLWTYGGTQLGSANCTAFGFYNSGNGRELQSHLPWGGGTIYWDVGGGATGGVNRINKNESDSSTYKGQWNHYVFTKNGTGANSSKIYQNGSLWLQGQTTASLHAITSAFIGSEIGGNNAHAGLVDNFAIWDRELSVAEIGVLAANDFGRQYASTVLADNPFVYYRIDGDTGANGSTLTDASVNGRDGTYVGGAVTIGSDTPLSVPGESAEFTGASGNYGRGTTAQPTTGQVTMEIWAKSDTPTWNNTGMLFSKREAYILHPTAGGKQLQFYVHAGGWKSVAFDLVGISGFDLTEWHHYVGTFDAASGALKLYIDGVLRAEADVGDSLTLTSQGNPTHIGFDNSGARYFDGKLDEAAIYDTVLSDSQIAAHYLAAEVVPEPATLAVAMMGLLVLAARRRRRA